MTIELLMITRSLDKLNELDRMALDFTEALHVVAPCSDKTGKAIASYFLITHNHCLLGVLCF